MVTIAEAVTEVNLQLPAGENATRPTFLMEKISALLEKNPGGLSGNAVETDGSLPYKSGNIRWALQNLASDGNVDVRPGPRNSKIHVLVRPFVPPRPELVQGEVE